MRAGSDASAAQQTALDWLKTRLADGPLSSDDALHALLPLMEQVQNCHERGEVAPLCGLAGIKVADDRLFFSRSDALKPQRERLALSRIDPQSSSGILVDSEYRVDEVEGVTQQNLSFGQPGMKIVRPIFLTGWVTWEDEVGHHDALTDVLLCGLLLAALTTGLDVNSDRDLETFVDNRRNLFRVNPDLNPVIARAIVQMTEPSRHQRLQDFPAVIDLLRGYRSQQLASNDQELLLQAVDAPRDRRSVVLEKLRERLFDISKRNRLLYYKSSLGMVAMTEASIPLRIDPKRIDPNSLFVWQGALQKSMTAGKSVNLGDTLRFDDAPYLSGAFDRLRSEDRKNRQEMGFSMLRLALTFLRWHNLKDDKQERIGSPLLLLPVRLDKKKGVRDSYTLTPLASYVEVNPVLRHYLDQLYGLKLPDRIELEELNLEELHKNLAKQINQSEPGVELRLFTRPAINLIHTRARKRLEVYRRRSRLTGRGIRRLGDIDYSYSAANFQPLGMQLFLKRVRPTDFPLSHLSDSKPRPRLPSMSGETSHAEPATDVVEKTSFTIQSEREANPYTWDVDACSVVLGNFNYRKMSLVRDYDQLLEQQDITTPVFEDLFTARPKEQREITGDVADWSDRFDVVASDPTQAEAVASAREGTSFIIQGPPGTGKSQTITNLIADAAARGQRVLFVCEKRAALDVVYHRLKQRGLERLCCLIHDSQEDKKPFIAELRATYEHYCQHPDGFAERQAERNDTASKIARGQEQLQRWTGELNETSKEEGLAPLAAVRRLIELDESLPELSQDEKQCLPSFLEFRTGGDKLRETEAALADLGERDCLGQHPLRVLDRSCLVAEQVTKHVQQLIATALDRVEKCKLAIHPISKELEVRLTISETRELLEYAERVADLSEAKLGSLLDPRDRAVQEIEKLAKDRRHLAEAIETARKKTNHWKQPFGSHEMADVVALCARVETSWIRFLLPGFWRLKRLMEERYDFSAHALRPEMGRLLGELQQVYEAQEHLEECDRKFSVDFVEGSAQDLLQRLQDLHLAQDKLSAGAASLRSLVIRDPLAHAQVAALVATRPVLDELEKSLGTLLAYQGDHNLDEVPALLGKLDEALAVLPDVAGPLSAFADSDEKLYRWAISHPWKADRIEAAVINVALERIYRAQRGLVRLNHQTVKNALERVQGAMEQLRVHNGELIVSKIHHEFRAQVAKASLPAAQLNKDEREWKKRYTRGRKELEHEFSKVMRYKSIRALSAEETGEVLADLKPVWLMSPLSISDTLPLDTDAFDFVIFDEASQITLEEAVPAIFRAKQAIVVGDEQQLPPTRFFGSRTNDSEDEWESAEAAALALNADSFLSHAARTLRSTMLGWHYRSRYERLIDFSNASFYRRQLLTIPDVHISRELDPIEVASTNEKHESSLITARPVSFHYVTDGVYEKRRNTPEAEHVASLVATLLSQQPELSIGVVAFSEAQQDEIERALARRGEEDEAFQQLYEAACEREEDDQFVGLFVKNLENVQGDERDVIILSVCYGHDASGKMRMNFGPINQAGGEKRLNVVFSRAKMHMALVTSIKHTSITNDYNDGAACLKRYLRFAEAASVGNTLTVEHTLEECCPDAGDLLARDPSRDPVVRSIAAWLQQAGFRVDEQVGSSRFRVDLAVRGAESYRLGVLVDTEKHYANPDVIEQNIERPGVLQAFGWKIERVLAKDWLENRESVKRRILGALN